MGCAPRGWEDQAQWVRPLWRKEEQCPHPHHVETFDLLHLRVAVAPPRKQKPIVVEAGMEVVRRVHPQSADALAQRIIAMGNPRILAALQSRANLQSAIHEARREMEEPGRSVQLLGRQQELGTSSAGQFPWEARCRKNGHSPP